MFKIKKITGQTGNNSTKDVETMVPLIYLRNFWRTLEKPLINCKINLNLNPPEKCVIAATARGNQYVTFSITDTT